MQCFVLDVMSIARLGTIRVAVGGGCGSVGVIVQWQTARLLMRTAQASLLIRVQNRLLIVIILI